MISRKNILTTKRLEQNLEYENYSKIKKNKFINKYLSDIAYDDVIFQYLMYKKLLREYIFQRFDVPKIYSHCIYSISLLRIHIDIV